MLSDAGQIEVGVHRLLRFLTLPPDCHSAQDFLLQLTACSCKSLHRRRGLLGVPVFSSSFSLVEKKREREEIRPISSP